MKASLSYPICSSSILCTFIFISQDDANTNTFFFPSSPCDMRRRWGWMDAEFHDQVAQFPVTLNNTEIGCIQFFFSHLPSTLCSLLIALHIYIYLFPFSISRWFSLYACPKWNQRTTMDVHFTTLWNIFIYFKGNDLRLHHLFIFSSQVTVKG